MPSDERIQQWIEIPEGMELPAQRSTVNRVGASVREVNTLEDLDGMIVNVELLEFPEGDESGVGRVIEILGYPDDFGVDVEIVIRKHHLPHEFPPEAIEQATRIPHDIAPEELAREFEPTAQSIRNWSPSLLTLELRSPQAAMPPEPPPLPTRRRPALPLPTGRGAQAENASYV